jgi:hypothetical protein
MEFGAEWQRLTPHKPFDFRKNCSRRANDKAALPVFRSLLFSASGGRPIRNLLQQLISQPVTEKYPHFPASKPRKSRAI